LGRARGIAFHLFFDNDCPQGNPAHPVILSVFPSAERAHDFRGEVGKLMNLRIPRVELNDCVGGVRITFGRLVAQIAFGAYPVKPIVLCVWSSAEYACACCERVEHLRSLRIVRVGVGWPQPKEDGNGPIFPTPTAIVILGAIRRICAIKHKLIIKALNYLRQLFESVLALNRSLNLGVSI
jgi:hypothetical protein